jgi:hypothetical protein
MVAASVLTTRGVHWGLGRHIYYLAPVQIQNAVKYVVLMDAPVVIACSLGRASFCLFLISTVGAKKAVRVILWVTLILQALINATQIVLLYCSCGLQMSALWDPSIPAKCLSYASMSDYLYFLGGLYPFSSYSESKSPTDSLTAWNAFTDLFLTIFPAYLLKDLNIERKKKIVIMILLCVSGL